jgi:hypothetical protein
MTQLEATFFCSGCGEEVEPIEHNGTFLLPNGLHECIDLEDSTVAKITSTGLELVAEDVLELEVEAHSIYPPGYEEHTLQWAENSDGEIVAIHVIPHEETSSAAKEGRARIKMYAGECREVSGSEGVISSLREQMDKFVADGATMGENDDD